MDDYSIKYGRVGGFKTAEDAENAYKIHNEDFQKRMNAHFIRSDKNTTLKDYLVYWFVSLYSERIESTTKLCAAHFLYRCLLPNIEDKIILRYVSSEYLNEVLARASNYCDSAGNKCRELLFTAFSDAVKYRFVENNPVIDADKYERIYRPVKTLNKEQTKVFLSAAKERNWFLEIILALYCGLRRGEIIGLRFSDFDLENGVMAVERQVVPLYDMVDGEFLLLNSSLEFREPKLGSKRLLKIPPIIVLEVIKRKNKIQLLKEKMGDKFHDQDLISCQKNGNPRHGTSLNTEMGYISDITELPKITPHSLRHMYATILVENKASLAKVSALLGHNSIHTTFQWYLDVLEGNEHIKEFLNREFRIEDEEEFYGFSASKTKAVCIL